MTADAEESVRCSVSGCSCLSFKPGSAELRSCDVCRHSWVLHAVQRLRPWPPVGCGAAAEAALPGSVFRLSSLVLYGARAVPVRLKILLDRLYSVLSGEQVRRILHWLGWTLADYVRGYVLRAEGEGAGPERWPMATPEEEQLVLQEFLRFGETRSMVQLMAPEISSAPTCCHSNGQGGEKGALLLPLHLPSSAFFCFAPPSKQEEWDAPPSLLSKCGAALAVETEPKVPSPWPPPGDGRGSGPQRGVAGLKSPSPFLPSLIFNSSSSLSVNPPKLQSPSPVCTAPSLPPPPPSSSAGRKGRVFCGVCGKSFYDKGTLKIHYNAVHLQIKHRCTVSGCSMVFSSLRSRNRHSANPNPRLHTHTHTHSQRAWLPQPPPPAATQLPPAVSGAKRGRATPPPPPPANGGRRQLAPAATRLWESCGTAPKKKKPRKSSTPLKIEREEGEEE